MRYYCFWHTFYNNNNSNNGGIVEWMSFDTKVREYNNNVIWIPVSRLTESMSPR